MIIKYFWYSIAVTFASWIIGMVGNGILKKTEFYKRIANLNFIKSETFNKILGLNFFKWIVKNTFFKFFNQKLKLKNKTGVAGLHEIRNEMTTAEIGHLIGFVVVAFFTMGAILYGKYILALISMVVNIFMNLYPSLLQQENKRRIDPLIKRLG